MKYKLTALLALLMIAVMCCTALPYSAAKTAVAETADNPQQTLLIGDVDGDRDITVLDATSIQRRLVDLNHYTELEEFLGDVDGDQKLTVLDSTVIQRRIAELGDAFWTKSLIPRSPGDPSITFSTFYPEQSYVNGSITVYRQTPVLLNLYSRYRKISGRIFRDYYTVTVDGERIALKDANTYYMIRFDQPGEHTVHVVANNVFGESAVETATVTVVDSPDKPYICDAEYDRESHRLSVQASGGSGEYEYRYYIRLVQPEPPTEAETQGQGPEPGVPPIVLPTFRPEPLPEGLYQLTSDYVSVSSLTIPDDILNAGMEYVFLVTVKDSNGRESGMTQIVEYQYYYYYYY